MTSSVCLECPIGFSTNYFFAANTLTGYNSAYYNPYTCYQIQPGTDTWSHAKDNCAQKGTNLGKTGITTMIVRTSNEWSDALRFVNFIGNFWVCLK